MREVRAALKAWLFWLPAIGLIGWLCVSTAHAYSTAERDACYPDAVRYCRHVLKLGMWPVYGCMIDHRAKLSKPCDAVFKSYGK